MKTNDTNKTKPIKTTGSMGQMMRINSIMPHVEALLVANKDDDAITITMSQKDYEQFVTMLSECMTDNRKLCDVLSEIEINIKENQ